MEKELVTTETIINYLKHNIEQKIPMSPTMYVDAAAKLNVLLADEHAELIRLKQIVSQLKADLIQEGSSVAKANALIEARDEFVEYQLQKAYCDRIVEFIRISKLQGRLTQDEYKGY